MLGRIFTRPGKGQKASSQEGAKLASLKGQRDNAREKNSRLQSRIRFLEPLAMAGWKKFASYEDYWEDQRLRAPEYLAQRAYETALWGRRDQLLTTGRCGVCKKDTVFEVDSQWANQHGPAWREKMLCRTCGLNTRLRAALQFLLTVAPPDTKPLVYATEQVTAFYRQLQKAYPDAIGSEFLSDGTPKGGVSSQGIRHEDVTALSFKDGSLDAIATFEVLEHVPDHASAVKEFGRVLKPGGLFWASFPFDLAAKQTQVRATVDASGTMTHHLPPEYHGDPLNADGCLCYQIFGWDVMNSLRSAGMTHLDVYTVWNPALGLIGPGLSFVAGRKALQ